MADWSDEQWVGDEEPSNTAVKIWRRELRDLYDS
jgi:hypothetical protein